MEVNLGEARYVNVSGTMLNEIVTPYSNPKLIKFLSDDSSALIEEDGSSIYVATGDENFIQLIIKDGDVIGAPGINIALVPAADIRAQTIVLKPSVAGGAFPLTPRSQQLRTNDYVDLIRELMRDAARNVLPTGFTRDSQWQGGRIAAGPVIGKPLQRMVGTDFVIEYYSLTNTGATAVELTEPNFNIDGVRAIAFVDVVILAPGQTTKMVWVKDR